MRPVLYDLDEDRWVSPYSTTPKSSYKQTVPQKLYLPRTFKPVERIEKGSVDFMHALKEVAREDYLPPDLVHGLVIEDSIAEYRLQQRMISWNRLLCISFGDSRLLVHPCGHDGGRRLCFSRFMPWYASIEQDLDGLNTRWQCIPGDCAEWTCGISPVRHLLYQAKTSRVYAMNAEAVSVFDVSIESDDPLFLYQIPSPNSRQLFDFCPLGDDRIIMLSENGSIAIAGHDSEPVILLEESEYKRVCSHPLGSPFHFIAASDSTAVIFEIRSRSSLQFFRTSSILSVASVEFTSLIAVSTDQRLLFFDLCNLHEAIFEWKNSLSFNGSIQKIASKTNHSMDISICISTLNSSHVLSLKRLNGRWTAPLLPQRIVQPSNQNCVGTDLLVDSSTISTFILCENSTVSYNVMVPSDDGKVLFEPYDPIKGVGQFNFSLTSELESSLKHNNNFVHKLFPDEFDYLNYSFVWNWLWYGRAEAASPVVPNGSSRYFGLGSHVTEEILRELVSLPISEPVAKESDVQMTDVASILQSRWSE